MKLQSEKNLQAAIEKLLLYRGVIPIRSRMDRATSNNVGTHNFLFAVCGRATAWEVKLPGKKCTPQQSAMHERLEKNGWDVAIIHSIDEAIAQLQRLHTA